MQSNERILKAVLKWGGRKNHDRVSSLIENASKDDSERSLDFYGSIDELGNTLSRYVYYQSDEFRSANNVKATPIFRTLAQHSKGAGVWHPRRFRDAAGYVDFWQTHGTKALDYLKRRGVYRTIESSLPILHFRCSDIPFNRNDTYRLPYDSCYHRFGEILKSRGDRRIVCLSNQNWKVARGTSRSQAIEDYARHFTRILSAYNISVDMQSHDHIEDFLLLHFSPLVLAPVNSSFSFMAKAHNLGEETLYMNFGSEFTSIPWNVGIGRIDHDDVQDYEDTEAVLALLDDSQPESVDAPEPS